MNSVISIKKENNIIWLIILLYILEQYFLEDEVFLVLEMVTIALLILSSRKIIIPQMIGLHPYVGYILFVTIMGVVKYGASATQRDLFYQLGSVVTIVLAYYLFIAYENKEKSLFSTVCLMLLISTVVCLFQGLADLSSNLDFATLRQSFSVGLKSISFMLPLLIGRLIIFKKKTLPWRLDIVAIIVWIVQIVLNLSRIALVNVGLSALVVIIVSLIKKRIRISSIIKLAILLFIVGLVVFRVEKFLPEEATDVFDQKIDNSLTEIDKDNEYNTMAEAQADWRGYENSQALKQWKNEDLFTQIFGAGNGRIISIYFVPDNWKEIIERQDSISGVTILHNTYYTLLIKGGIVMLLLLFFFLFMNVRIAIKLINNKKYLFEGIVLLSIVCYIMVDGYVVRTMIEKGEDIAPMLLLGYINAEYYRTRYVEVEEND